MPLPNSIPSIIITRPEPDASFLAPLLHQKGYRTVSAPVLKIIFQPVESSYSFPADIQAILFTSANAVRAFCHQFEKKNWPRYKMIFAVGDKTAEEASLHGFNAIENSKGDVDKMITHICAQSDPENGILLHPCGKNKNGNLGKALEKKGFHYFPIQSYNAEVAKEMPEQLIKEIHSGNMYATVLYSPRSARIFIDLCVKFQKEIAHVKKMRFFCLSTMIAKEIILQKPCRGEPLFFETDIHVAPEPTQASLLLLIPPFNQVS